MLKAIKIQLYPNNAQITQFNKLLGCYRFVYNNCLALKKQSYEKDKTNENLTTLGHYFHNNLTKSEEYKWLNENQVIVMEDLNVSGIMKNHHLARSIQELSLHEFRRIMEYKSKWYGRNLVIVNRYFASSKLCNVCGYKNDSLSLQERNWVCPNCQTHHDRDKNASLNIRDEGLRIISSRTAELTLAESSSLEHSLKQEIQCS